MGAGYDISPATSRATAEAANQEAGTIFNFGSGTVTPNNSFVADPTATSTASTSKGTQNESASVPDGSASYSSNDKLMLGIAIAGLVVSVFSAVYLTRK